MLAPPSSESSFTTVLKPFRITAFCYGWPCGHTPPHTFVYFHPGSVFLLRLQEGADWTLVTGFQVEDTLWCFLLGSMTQWSGEKESFEEEVHSEFSEPQTSNWGLWSHTQKITDTPNSSSLHLQVPALALLSLHRKANSTFEELERKEAKTHNCSLGGMELPLS